MARPIKNSCDYFTHDNDMRNHRKVKSIRNKFGIQGYAIWSMLIEYLTGIDGNEFEYSDMEFELISGDFGVSVTEIRDVVDYCIKLEMLFNRNNFIYSETLNKRLEPVYLKRGKAKELSERQKRLNGKFAENDENAEQTVVTVTETPQSKLNKTKENNSFNTPEEKKEKGFDLAGKEREEKGLTQHEMSKLTVEQTQERLLQDNGLFELFVRATKLERKNFEKAIEMFIQHSIKKIEYPRVYDKGDDQSKKHFKNWYSLIDFKEFRIAEPKSIVTLPTEEEKAEQVKAGKEQFNAYMARLKASKEANDKREDEKLNNTKNGLRELSKLSSNLPAQGVSSYLLR